MNPTDEELIKIYESTKTIAVVGLSGDESKPSNRIPAYLQGQGYRIIPVSPKGGELLGEKVFTSLDDVEGTVDLVDVFRPAEEAPAIAKSAAKIGAKVLWLQEGIRSEEAEVIAKEESMTIVMDMCLGVTHKRLGLGPGPWG